MSREGRKRRIIHFGRSFESNPFISFELDDPDLLDYNEFFQTLQNSMAHPRIRKIITSMAKAHEDIEKEQADLQQEETSLRVSDLERKISGLQNEIGFVRRKQLLETSKISNLRENVDKILHRLTELEIKHSQSLQTYYNKLSSKFLRVDEVKIAYIQETPGKILVTVFYDDIKENYSKTEMKIFDAFDEIRKEFPRIKTDILVLVYESSVIPPKNAIIILER